MNRSVYLEIAGHLVVICSACASMVTCAAGQPNPLVPWAASGRAAERVILSAHSFGVIGDGITDDGPAIGRLLEAATRACAPVIIQFEPDKTYRVATAPTRYVFPLDGAAGLTLDGQGSLFLLDPHLRMLRLERSDHVTIRRLKVDFSPLPFAEGMISAIDPAARFMDVRLERDGSDVVGGPTGQDGEQAFFAMLWHDGPYGTLGRHCWVERMEHGPDARTIRMFAAANFDGFDRVEPNRWRISLPVPGIAHRYGPGACFAISGNHTVTFEDVELWSAPWFGFEVFLNQGELAFRRVNIRPKPDSGRLTSTWRDGFHVKANRASLLWEDCTISGMNDDAFNISTHSSVVSRLESPTRIQVRQKFPLLPVPWHEGATMTAADEQEGHLLGNVVIRRVETGPTPPMIQGKAAAPVSVLTLEHPVAGLREGTMVWDPAWCNPDTTLRRCRIGMSCRFQSPVRLEHCESTALLWFYSDGKEGAFPHRIRIRDCVLRRGRGNPSSAVIVSDGPLNVPASSARPRAIHDVEITGNRIWGDLVIKGAEGVRLSRNEFLEKDSKPILIGNIDLRMIGNVDAEGQAIEQ